MFCQASYSPGPTDRSIAFDPTGQSTDQHWNPSQENLPVLKLHSGPAISPMAATRPLELPTKSVDGPLIRRISCMGYVHVSGRMPDTLCQVDRSTHGRVSQVSQPRGFRTRSTLRIPSTTTPTPNFCAFNIPYQLSVISQVGLLHGLVPLRDCPRDAKITSLTMRDGYVLSFATVGIWDDLGSG